VRSEEGGGRADCHQMERDDLGTILREEDLELIIDGNSNKLGILNKLVCFGSW
jgi:hypothetical protein